MKYIEYLVSLNYYITNNNIFSNKIIQDKLLKIKFTKDYDILCYYENLKKTLNYFNPFFGTTTNTYLEKIKSNFKKKPSVKNIKEVYTYRNHKKYKIPYKELSYIFNMSIEKIRIK
ncbi:hypothetical protein [Candidatus Carsonella ruddii]|uniref:hypothetical protein n=1 Tax=Carsonella ruddii TaxID=114186 RepID=UPI00035C0173|nr:hypothetical protein [Candidatus Carsonella ruddii]AGS06631.1 hypothetical protein CRDC_00735 [Candidatus Carsonella ruddii DC]ALA96873.1 hypothetical protein AMC76_00790 [Candidatus Carsonella ruddii]